MLGSQAVAQAYAAQGLEVYGMSQVWSEILHKALLTACQFDMTAWVKRGTREEVGVIVDYVDDR